ncbi:MAG: hypothetical protein PHX83_06040 [Acidobacteriia bacterium]|nr:hypothetical protein [Terriglobia bacterium]
MKTRKNLEILLALTALLVLFSGTTISAANICVNQGGTHGCASSIQGAISTASSGDTILIKNGSYFENVVVDRPLTLTGENDHDTIIYPAISNPNPCPGSSLCGGTASNIILVQADSVTISHMTLDGDNPHLTSGVVAGGADVDARNGIIVNFLASPGIFNNLTVDHVTVKNVYLRGIYASSGGTFNFHDNEVDNVQGDVQSICMFNFGGSGIMAHNKASDCNDALSSNWSGGVQFLNNEITHSGSGVHTDNAGGFGSGTSDLIQGNTVRDSQPNGYGIFVFVPYFPVTVDGNKISKVDVGLAAFGGGAAAGVATFSNNEVHGEKKTNSTGVYVTTDDLFGDQLNVTVNFVGNLIKENADGFVVQSQSPATLTLSGTCNGVLNNSNSGMTSLAGSGVSNVTLSSGDFNDNGVGVNNQTGAVVHAENNWWGCKGGPGAHGCDTVQGNVSFTPILAKQSKCAPN